VVSYKGEGFIAPGNDFYEKEEPMKKTLLLITVLVFLFLLAGCGKYQSSYKAVGFVHSNGATAAEMSFYSFEGRMVFKLKSSGEGDISFTAMLESGEAAVYYDYSGTKSKLVAVGAGEEFEGHGGYIESGTVYIIVETTGECVNGSFSFHLK